MSLLLQRFRAEVSKSKDVKMKTETQQNIGHPSGFLGFDFLNGTVVHVKTKTQEFKYYSVGVVDGSINMLIGRSGCGKTTFATQCAANIVRPFPTSCVFHDDIENGIIESRKMILTRFSEDIIDKKYIARNSGITAENFFERLRMIHDLKMADPAAYSYDTGYLDIHGNPIIKMEPTVYILDSLALLMPEKYADETEVSGQMSATAAAKSNSLIFKRMMQILKPANIILIVINHILDDVSINPMQKKKASIGWLKQGETLPGGKEPQYLSNNIIRFDDNTKLKEDKDFGIDGNLVDISLVKSRQSKSGKSITAVFHYDTGFDPELSLLVMLKQAGRVNGAGAYLYIDDYKEKKFAQKNFKSLLNKDPEFQRIVMDAAIPCLQDLVYDSQLDYLLNDETTSITDNILDRLKVAI